MTLSDQIQTDMGNILSDVGTTIDIYFTPNYTRNTEQEITSISLGTKTSALAFFYSEAGEEFVPEVEGIDRKKRFRIFLQSSVGTIAADTLIRIPSSTGDVYTIVDIETNPVSASDTSFYDLTIERFQPQGIIS